MRPLLLALLGACSAELASSPEAPQIDDYIASLPYLPVDPPSLVPGPPSTPSRAGDYACTTQNLKETRQYDRIVAYAAGSDALWPGALVGATSVDAGLFTPIVLPRAPATISVSLPNLAGSKSATFGNPSLASYRDALARILDAEVTGSTPADIYAAIEQVHSEEQLDMALGVRASWPLGIANLEASFDWSRQDVMSRYVVAYTQAYYTVDLDAPSRPSSVFDRSVGLADVEAKITAADPPVYVSSVTYGRLVLFTFESTYSAEEMSAALDFAYAGGVDVSGDVSVTYKDILARSKITAFILGGDGGAAAQTIDSYDALIAFIKSGGNYSKDSPGAPIAYKLGYLKDGSPARMSLTTDYRVEQCTRVSQKVAVVLEHIRVISAGGDAGDDLELYGTITAQGVPLFAKDASHYVQIHEGATFPATGTIALAVIDVAPEPGQAIVLRADLLDRDTVSGDDSVGDETVANPFETGWRKQVSVTVTGDGAQLELGFSLTPI